ncbi:hypothetical protein LRR80_01617 [Streptomyces sp. RO-S4]|nr:hypothetical protein [Streptomyces sp. RO-S4]
MLGTAVIMTFSDAPPLVYTEASHSGDTIDDPGLVKEYRWSYDLLRAAALPPEGPWPLSSERLRMAEMPKSRSDLSQAVWRRSSYSNGSGGNCVEVAEGAWRKSTYSNGDGGDCVEVCDAHTAVVPVRDSKVPDGPVLVVAAPAWASFVESLA